MSLITGLVSFGIRQLTGVEADAVIGVVERHFSDSSRKLPLAIARANDRAWQALGIALAGDGFLDQIKVFFASGDDKGVREQVRLFLADKRFSFEGTPAERRRACLAELREARGSGVLSAAGLPGPEVARQAAAFQRYADPTGLVEGATRAVALTADALAPRFPSLAALVRQPVLGGPPLLAAVFCFFLRREVETDSELANGLLFDGQRRLLAGQGELLAGLGRLCESQEEGFAQVEGALSGLGDRFDEAMAELIGRLGKIEQTAVATHEAVLDMQAELRRVADSPRLGREEIRDLIAAAIRQEMRAGMQSGEVRPRDSSCLRSEEERRAVKALLERFRSLPEDERRQLPALINGLGKLQVGTGDFDGARKSFAEAARATPDVAARAEARYNAYRAALEARRWDDALAAVTDAASLDPGRFEPFPLHRYRPRRILGAGGFGTAFLCHDDNLDEEVVVKTLHAGDLDRSVGDLIREARLLRKLDHPAIIRVRDAEYADGRRKARPYIVMEYFSGVSLEEHLRGHGRLEVADLVAVAQQVARGMQAAHRLVPLLIHRDLKPDNVLVRKEGGTWDVRVIDFGLAVRRDALEAAAGLSSGKSITAESITGTLKYAPPEQLGELPQAVPGPSSDVFAFGRTCCQALFLNTQPNRKQWASLPAELADLLERCIEHQPADRCQGFDEVLAVLDALRPGAPDKHRQVDPRLVPPEPQPAPKGDTPPAPRPQPPLAPTSEPSAKPLRPVSANQTLTPPLPPAEPASPEPVRSSCPHCRTSLKVPADLHGKKVKCPKCSGVFTPEVPVGPAEAVPDRRPDGPDPAAVRKARIPPAPERSPSTAPSPVAARRREDDRAAGESVDLGGRGDEAAGLIAGLCPACTFRGKKAPAIIPPDLHGKTVTCPQCGHQFRVGPPGQGLRIGQGDAPSSIKQMMQDVQRLAQRRLDDLHDEESGGVLDIEDIDLLIEEETGPGGGLGAWPDGEAGEGVAVPIPGQWFRRPEGSPEGPPTAVVSPGGMRVHPGYVYGIDVGVEAAERKEPDFTSLSLLRPASCMRWLKLNKCKITDACLAHLAGLTHLERVDLRGPHQQFTDAGLAHFKGLRRLRQLNLSDCKQIGDAGLAHLQGLIELEELYLSDCDRITDAGLAALRKLTKLKKLKLRGCRRITDAGKQGLGKALPGCTIT